MNREAKSTRRFCGWFYPSKGDFIAFVGNTRYGKLVRDVVRTFRENEPFPSQGGAMPEAMSDIGRSDHWPFWQEGYPALMVTDTASFRLPLLPYTAGHRG